MSEIIEHHIQKDIIERLARAASLRFSELKPKGLENNMFMYHLGVLRRQHLIEKDDNSYRLSDKGLTYIDSFSFKTKKTRQQPKIISILAVQNTSGEWLLARRKYQPYIDKYMFVSGKQHFGEAPESHAQRELKEKLGFEIPLQRRGLYDIRIHHGEQVITHVTAHVYSGIVEGNAVPPSTHQFDYEWSTIDTPGTQLLAGTRELAETLQKEPGLFFLSLDAEDI